MTHPPGAQPPEPAYPSTPTPPEYPQYPQYPTSAVPTQYPTVTAPAPPLYPQAETPPTYPTTAAPPLYPQAETPPTYPTTAAPPPYPQAETPPTYPTTTAPPPYPQAETPPTYPTTTAPAAPPPYPQAEAPPQYPQEPTHSTPPEPSVPSPPHPHHIATDQRRVHLAAHQRGADATAIGNLLLALPHFLCSLLVVALVSLFFGGFGILVVLAWLASGLLIFHRPTESAVARHLLRLRHPTAQERAKLEPVWREVTARAGVEGRTYELWVEDSDSLNAVAAAGHIVGVTRFAMNELPNGELAAVMAHELGHHVGGHAWSSLLGYWYALPGRLVWRVLRGMGRVVFKVSRVFSCFGAGFLLLAFGSIAAVTVSTLYGLPLLILVLPYALAAVSRRAELRADQHAAALGFAPMLAAVLDKLHHAEEEHRAALRAHNGGAPVEESPLSTLLSSHPDHHTRLHHLQPYLELRR